MHLYRNDLKETARRLRLEMTPAERALWSRLRRKQVAGLQFYRQKPIGGFVVDFYCPKACLVVEVDGEYHEKEEQRRLDRIRDQELRREGLTSLRFTNEDVLARPDAVLSEIQRVVQDSVGAVTDSPSPAGGRQRPPSRRDG